MADKSAEQQELRRKLASMKKDYARTLHNVEKSEKAKRARSHVQRKLAEQAQLSSTSPSCTHTFSRRTDPKINTSTDEPLQDEKTRGAGDESFNERDFKSMMATRRRRRQRRSVSFIIPPSERDVHDDDEVEKREGHLRTAAIKRQDEQLESKSKRSSLPELSPAAMLEQSNDVKVPSISKALLINDISGDSKISTHIGRDDRIRSKENVVLVIPESQLTESLGEGGPDVSPVTLAVLQPKENRRIKAEDEQNVELRSGKSDKDTTKFSSTSPLQEDTTKSSSISLLQEFSHYNSSNNNCNSTNKIDEKIEASETSLKPPQDEIRKRRAGRRSLKRSRKPRELTASDISMKEVVQSQSTEEGSHTWIEGLMYPVEYYVRRTRSMTSTQSSQSQSYSSSQRYMDRNDSQRDMSTQLRTTEQTDSLTDSTTRCKDSPVPQASVVKGACMDQLEVSRNQLEVGQGQTESSRNLTDAPTLPPESDSDSSRSQLSESLLKTSLTRPQDCLAGSNRDNDKLKLSRQTKTRKIQRRRVIRTGSSRASLSTNSFNYKMTCVGEDSAFTANPTDSKSNPGHTSSVQEPQLSSNTPDLCSRSTAHVSTPDLRSNPCTEDDGRTESQPEHNAGSILPALGNLRLPRSDFALPDEDFGTLKEAKLKTLPKAAEAAKHKCDDGDNNIYSSLPMERENISANTNKSEKSESIPAEHHHKNSNDQLVSGLSRTTQNKVLSPVTYNSPIQKPYQSDRNIAENSTPEMAPPFSEAPHLKQIRMDQREDIDSVQPSLDTGSQSRSSISGKIQPGSVSIGESPGKNILQSQFSLTQFHDSCSLAFPSAGCTLGSSPSCSRDDTDGVMLTENVPRSPQDVDMEAEGEDLGDGDHKVDSCPDSKLDEVVDASSFSRPSVTSSCNPTNHNSGTNLQQHTVFVYPLPSNQTISSKDGSTVCSNLSNAVPHEPSAGNQSAGDQPTSDVTEGTNNGSITPPTVHSEASGAVSSNIDQKSPFAGGATGSPFGRAEEPKAMSQCEVEVLSEDNEAEEMVTRHDLALIGCLQLDLPWESSPAIRDVASGVVNLDGETSILVLVYQHSLVIWRYYEGTQEWEILQSWVIPKEEEFSLVECLPSSKQNEVAVVVAGKFASCAVRILTFDTLTEELQKLDVSLSQSLDDQVPYLLCTTSKQDFIVAVKDTKNETTVFSVQALIESRDVHVVTLATGCNDELTSLLKVKDTAGIVMATTSHNHILLWCLMTGKLLKDVLIKPVTSGSRVSCLEAVAELGLLFLIVVYHDDVSDVEGTCNSRIGAIIAINPHTDKMLEFIDYNLPSQHENASLVDGVIHNATLLAKLSDGSLHQWEISTGNLLNYSSGNPTNHSLRSAQLCNSQVVLIRTDQYLQMYDEYS